MKWYRAINPYRSSCNPRTKWWISRYFQTRLSFRISISVRRMQISSRNFRISTSISRTTRLDRSWTSRGRRWNNHSCGNFIDFKMSIILWPNACNNNQSQLLGLSRCYPVWTMSLDQCPLTSKCNHPKRARGRWRWSRSNDHFSNKRNKSNGGFRSDRSKRSIRRSSLSCRISWLRILGKNIAGSIESGRERSARSGGREGRGKLGLARRE